MVPFADLIRAAFSKERRNDLSQPVMPPPTGAPQGQVDARLRLKETLDDVARARARLARERNGS